MCGAVRCRPARTAFIAVLPTVDCGTGLVSGLTGLVDDYTGSMRRMQIVVSASMIAPSPIKNNNKGIPISV